MANIILTNPSNFNSIEYTNPNLLKNSDILCVECTEYFPERSNNPELQIKYSFGLTQLGGLTVSLGDHDVKKIVLFNYRIEELNQVGLCLPYNLVIAPSSFFKKLYLNIYDLEVKKHIDDIIDANETHQKRGNIYINFLASNCPVSYWENEYLKNLSLNNLKDILNKKTYRHTKNIYLIS